MESVAEQPKLRVSIISDSELQRDRLAELFENNNLQVINNRTFQEHSIEAIDADESDLLVLDLDESVDYDLEFFDEILNSRVPVIFNDNVGQRGQGTDSASPWARNLLSKIMSVAEQMSASAAEAESESQEEIELVQPLEVKQVEVSEPGLSSYTAARQVWVLGASIGGPQSVQRFLAEIPGSLPVAFVLAQHIGDGFEEVLAKQLDRSSEFTVLPAEEQHQLRHREVVVTPVNRRVLFDKFGRVVLRPTDPGNIYTPSIDAVMIDTAVRYGQKSGAIIFSGMGKDGTQGCRVMAARGARVWAQNAETCVISSMPDAARRSGVVSFSGTPEELAANLVNTFNV